MDNIFMDLNKLSITNLLKYIIKPLAILILLSLIVSGFIDDTIYFYSNLGNEPIQIDEELYEKIRVLMTNRSIDTYINGNKVNIYWTDLYKKRSTFSEQFFLNFHKRSFWGIYSFILISYFYYTRKK
ncbi:MAG: hypothetical protein IPN10_13665 [Saprospiraceae bacterium]|nr:hypothetical protein [Saprospiraceae bacterium]